MTAALPSGPPPSTSLPAAPADAAAALGRLSATGVALLDAGRTDEAIDVLRHAVAAAEPGADDLLARAYLDGGDWYAAADLMGRLVAHGHVRFAGRLGVALGPGRRHRPRGGGLPPRPGARRARGVQRLRDPAQPRRTGSTRRSRCSGALRTRAIRRPRRTWSSCCTSRAICAPRCRSRSATRTSRDPTRSSRSPSCVPQPAARTRPRSCTGGPRSWARCGRTARTARSCSWCGATRRRRSGQFREAARHDEHGWQFTLGQFLVDDGRAAEARPYVAAAAALGDNEAVRLLAEIDGEDPYDD